MKPFIAFLLTFSFFIISCGGEKSVKNSKDSIVVIEEAGSKPDWVEEGIKIGKDENNQKVILMVCYGKSPKKDIAKKLSTLNCATYVPSYFHKIILNEFEKAMTSANVNKADQEKFKSSSILTGKINVSGMIQQKSWWRNVAHSFADANKNSETYFEFYSQYSLSYARFTEIIEEVKSQTIIKKDGHSLTKEQLNLLNNKLDELKMSGEKLLAANLVLGKKD